MQPEINSPKVRRQVEAIAQKVQIPPTELDIVRCLTWYCLNYKPQNYLEFGISSGYAVGTVAMSCPTVEIYGIDSWQQQPNPVKPPDYATGILRNIGYRGYTRFITGDSHTAFCRLCNSFIGSPVFDLILFREEIFATTTFPQLRDILPHLAPKGAMVITSNYSVKFDAIWNLIQRRFFQFQYIKINSNCGLVLAGSQPTNLEINTEVFPPQINSQLSLATSELDRLIPPEIKNDEFYRAIQEIAQTEKIKTVLEIGSSSGEGSTQAFVEGLRKNPHQTTLFCLEASQPRYQQLQKRYAGDTFVKCYNFSSISLENFPKETEVIQFYQNTKTNINDYPLERVIGWLRQDIEYLKKSGITENGINKIKAENRIEKFDVVLIDGSEFTGKKELEEIYGAKFIFLDDINSFKNYHNHQKLLADKNYNLVSQNNRLRNGYSIFKRVFNSTLSHQLPIHFFTIVLNGEPFIQYHIEILKKLPFQWHWHIIEGVADLKHDTAWSLPKGGRISDDIHSQGLSVDGTTKYLDRLKQLYPENMTIYRQPKGIFWDGKQEMVNAPLGNINQECLLWQIDVDELWTLEQICAGRQLFINNPEKTAAFYWCWYFVGENLVISTRNGYAQNPQQEWLRTWRFKPGMKWATHEPPKLIAPLANGEYGDVGEVNPLLHEETEKQGLIFQHFAYCTPEQLRFKEQYYGYKGAISDWLRLQKQTQFPVALNNFFAWVKDYTMVDTLESRGVMPIAKRNPSRNTWEFEVSQNSEKTVKIVIDGVFFQHNATTGIARVWRELLSEWVANGFAQNIMVLDRGGTAPKIPGIKYHSVEQYNYREAQSDRQILEQICQQEEADLFVSTYYTTPLSTPSVFMAYDMVPEVLGQNLDDPMWQQKHYGIRHASAYMAISEKTARDLGTFFPHISPESVTVAPCGVNSNLFPATPEEISGFKLKYGINKPYFLLVGQRIGWKGYKNAMLFFRAFSQFEAREHFDIICVGSNLQLEPELQAYIPRKKVSLLQLNDEELRVAYSGAVALIYPSKYEGFGLPLVEAMACGCPVITCPNASIPEVAGNAALYVDDKDVQGLLTALGEVQKPEVRQELIVKGFEQANKFSWSKMATIVSSTLQKFLL